MWCSIANWGTKGSGHIYGNFGVNAVDNRYDWHSFFVWLSESIDPPHGFLRKYKWLNSGPTFSFFSFCRQSIFFFVTIADFSSGSHTVGDLNNSDRATPCKDMKLVLPQNKLQVLNPLG